MRVEIVSVLAENAVTAVTFRQGEQAGTITFEGEVESSFTVHSNGRGTLYMTFTPSDLVVPPKVEWHRPGLNKSPSSP